MDTSKLPSTRKEAQRHGLPYYFTGQPCKHGHIAPRKTKGACVECIKADSKRVVGTRNEYLKAWGQSERGKESRRKYYERNKELVKARANATDVALRREWKKKHKQQNVERVRIDCSMYKRRVRLITPPWLSKEQRLQIREIYKMAMEMTKLTGVRYTVDHIVPVRSPVVCGLHVPWNLQILPSSENSKKGNRFRS